MRRHRGRLASLVALAVTLSPIPSSGQEVFALEELAPGVWAGLVLPQPPMYVFANALIVERDEGLLVVDSHSSPSAARAMIAALEARTDRPVRHLVNTHFHGDHVYGNESYTDRFPGVEIIAHENTLRDIEVKLGPLLEEEIAGLPASIRDRESWIRTRAGPDGEALSDEQIAALTRSARLRSNHLTELRELRLRLPDRTFADRLELDDARTPIWILSFGPAHTDGDALVYLPRQRILAAGDLLEEALPWVDENSHPVGWANTLDRISELEIDVILPSHGSLLPSRQLLELQRAFFRYVVDFVEAGLAEGRTLEEIQAGIDPAAVPPPLPPGSPQLGQGWAEYLRRVVERTFADASEHRHD